MVLVLVLVPIMIGAAASFGAPALRNPDLDLALFTLVTDSLPAPIVTLIGIAGTLSAIVPMSVFLVAIGTLCGRTILGGGLRGTGASDSRQRSASQLIGLMVGAIALAGALLYPTLLVNLSVVSYEGITQLVPAVLLGLYWRRLTLGVRVGLATGGTEVLLLHATGNDPLFGVNGGLVALIANLAVAALISAQSPKAEDLPSSPEPSTTQA